MAAPVLQSTQTAGTNPDSNGSISVTKPTSLAVGELMIAFAVTGTNFTSTFPSGFVSLGQLGFVSGAQTTAEIAYKIADSSDVAASNFSFTAGVASISRITGATTTGGGIKYNGALVTNSGTASVSGITPSDYGDATLLMQFWSVANGSSPNIANYAIATSNPTWSQAYEITSGGNSVAVASASRPEVTATGNFSVTGGGGAGADWTGQIISIPVPFVITITESTTLTESFLQNSNISKSESTALTETSEQSINRYSNQSKNSSTFTNQSSNSSSWTNQSKNSSSWTNQSKSTSKK